MFERLVRGEKDGILAPPLLCSSFRRAGQGKLLFFPRRFMKQKNLSVRRTQGAAIPSQEVTDRMQEVQAGEKAPQNSDVRSMSQVQLC